MLREAVRVFSILVGVVGLLAAQPIPIPPFPIPQQLDARPVPEFLGDPAVAQPIAAPIIPQNPFMAIGAWNNIHNDAYMSDTYFSGGPLGHSPEVLSTFLGTVTPPDNIVTGLVVVMAFDQEGHMIAAAVRVDRSAGTARVLLVLIDPDTLETLAVLPLPVEQITVARNFRPAGSYFYLDQLGRIIIGTVERTIWVVSHTATAFSHDATYDLRSIIPADDSIQAVQPDWNGRLWFTTKGGLVGTLDSSGNPLGTHRLEGERIANSHATDETGGVFIASTYAMYRFDADSSGSPVISWREPYDAGTHVKSGQVDIGTGTTPTLMGTEYVTITDNAEPRMHVLVYRRAKVLTGPRLVCAEPVFEPGNSSTENSLVATDKSIVVENNFGYKSEKATLNGSTTKPGITRIDVDCDGCRTVWTNEQENIPTVVTKMSLANGLIYTYTKPKGPANTDAWYLTAIDFETGRTVFKQLAGTGILYNNHYAALYLGPNGTAYVGVLGGIVAIRDTE
jgi:hypothetical protein